MSNQENTIKSVPPQSSPMSFCDGWIASANGVSMEKNPYNRVTQVASYLSWENGWLDYLDFLIKDNTTD